MAANVGQTGATEGFEAEDRLLLDDPYINDADTYIDEIHFALPLYRYEKDMFSNNKMKKVSAISLAWFQVEGLQKGVAVAEQRNIPYYIHIDKTTYPFVEVGKKKALTSLADFMEELEKSGARITEKPEPRDKSRDKDRKEIGEDEVFIFVQAAKDILAGKEQFEGAEVKGKIGYRDEAQRKANGSVVFRNLAGRPNANGRFYRDIDSDLHNAGTNPEARDTLEMLASLMRSTKQKTIKDFETYLNQVYKKNHPEGDPTGVRDL